MSGPHEDRSILDHWRAAPEVVLRYGDSGDHVVEVWSAASPQGVVLLLHGGFWRAEFDRVHLRPLANALAGRGFSVLLPEFRRVGNGGGWPGTFDDIAAVAGVLDQTPFSGLPVVVAGHSAGGHLALWLTSTAELPNLVGVVPLAPVADLGAAYERGLGDGAVQTLLGGTPDEQPGRYEAADPVRLPTPPAEVVILHGTFDSIVPIELSRTYARGREGVRVVELPTGHFELIDPGSEVFPEVVAVIGELVNASRGS